MPGPKYSTRAPPRSLIQPLSLSFSHPFITFPHVLPPVRPSVHRRRCFTLPPPPQLMSEFMAVGPPEFVAASPRSVGSPGRTRYSGQSPCRLICRCGHHINCPVRSIKVGQDRGFSLLETLMHGRMGQLEYCTLVIVIGGEWRGSSLIVRHSLRVIGRTNKPFAVEQRLPDG